MSRQTGTTGQGEYSPKVRPRHERHSIRGVDYNVWQWGATDKPTMIYLHGWGDVGAAFQFVVDALGDAWHVIAPDWRGFGQSRVKTAAYWFPDYLADLDQLLALYAPAEKTLLVGHSMGANVAGLYAGVMPERVAAFVNVEGFGLADTDPTEAPGRYRKWLEGSRTVPTFSTIHDLESLAARILSRSPRMADARARYIAGLWAQPADGGYELFADPRHKLPNAVLYRRAEAEACSRQVSAPVLLVAGSDSPFREGLNGQVDGGSHALPFPNSRAVTIDGAGHMLHFEAPEALAACIEEFFAEYL